METARLDNGLYIVIEGSDAVGHTTQVEQEVIPWLEINGIRYGANKRVNGTGFGIDLVATREPGGTERGEDIRKRLLIDRKIKYTPEQELEEFTKQRMYLDKEVVSPALALGKVVVSERCYMSSYAYQGFGGGVEPEHILQETQEAISDRMYQPDAWVMIDVTPDESAKRMEREGRAKDKIEERTSDYFWNVRDGYLEFSDLRNVPVVDGHPSPKEVGRAIIESLAEQLDMPAR